jgi:hypothetical protein
MIDISLSEETKKNIELSIGIPIEKIESLDAVSVDKLIEEQNKKSLVINSNKDPRLPERGSVYLTLNRYIEMLNIDKKLSAI